MHVVAVRQMSMKVDQAREQRRAAEIDHGGSGRDRDAGCHFFYPIAGDADHGRLERSTATAIDKAGGPNDQHLGRRGYWQREDAAEQFEYDYRSPVFHGGSFTVAPENTLSAGRVRAFPLEHDGRRARQLWLWSRRQMTAPRPRVALALLTSIVGVMLVAPACGGRAAALRSGQARGANVLLV